MKIINLGATADNKSIFLNYDDTNVEYHLLETPNLVELVKEAVPHLVLGDGDQIVHERDMGRVVGTTNLVETGDSDDIVYAKRIGRNKYSRFVKNREAKPCRSIVTVFRKRGDEYYLWTAMCGELLPPEAHNEDSEFNATHAMVYDEKLVQLSTLTKSWPMFTQKYTIVQFFEYIQEGYEFSSSNWPLHSTVIDTFAIEWSVDEMTERLTGLLRNRPVVYTEANEDRYFGENKQVQVVLLKRTDSLVELHQDILSTLKQGRLTLNDPQFAGDGFLPHATVQKHARLNKGDKVQFTELGIIDMFPDKDPCRRKVLRTIKIGD